MKIDTTRGRWWHAPGLWVLALGIVCSAWLGWVQWREISNESQARFERETTGFSRHVEAHFNELATLLRATSGFFSGSDRVTPEEFSTYARALDLTTLQPGIQGLGYSVWLPQAGREALEASQRAYGEAGFTVWPRCAGATFSSIVSLEPKNTRNRRAMGYDMLCEPVRRAAMTRARHTGQPVLSGMVRLVHEREQPQPGALLFHAIRGAGRGERVGGWVYIPIRVSDMLAALLAREPNQQNFFVRLSDITDTDAPQWVYAARASDKASYLRSDWVRLHGRTWQIDYAPSPTYLANQRHEVAGYALASGLALSFLMAGAVEWLTRSRRRAERLARAMTQDLRERETELATLFNASPDATLIVDQAGRVVRHNPAACQLFGYSAGQFQGLTVEQLIPDARRAAHSQLRERFMRNPQNRQMGSGLALAAQRADGVVFQIEILLAPLELHSVAHVLVVARDVSERVAQEALRAAMLADKETLLQEVHHRVKNNLQVIHSLFELQKDTLADTAALSALEDAQARVRAMALIHQVLYQSRDFGEVDFAGYLGLLLRDLGASLGRPEISVRIDAEPLRMTLDRAIPSGLLMSEAVGNAFKHAFPDGREGNIVLLLAKTENGVVMQVTDDGVGLPADWRERDTLGMRLIALLAEQCDASLDIAGDAGTRITLRFQDTVVPDSVPPSPQEPA